MFNYNPIKDDKLVNEKIEQYEKARIDKKVSNYLKKQGTHSISHLKTFDEVVNDIVQTDTPTRWKFDNEKKIYKVFICVFYFCSFTNNYSSIM